MELLLLINLQRIWGSLWEIHSAHVEFILSLDGIVESGNGFGGLAHEGYNQR